MAAAHRCWAVVTGLVVEGGVALDQAVCSPLGGGGGGSAGAQEGLGIDVEHREQQLLRCLSTFGMSGWDWCIGDHGFQVGVRLL